MSRSKFIRELPIISFLLMLFIFCGVIIYWGTKKPKDNWDNECIDRIEFIMNHPKLPIEPLPEQCDKRGYNEMLEQALESQ